MNEVNNISLEGAADSYMANQIVSGQYRKYLGGSSTLIIQDAFKAGAQWQKEQDKELKEAAEKILSYYHPNTYDAGYEVYLALKKSIDKYNN